MTWIRVFIHRLRGLFLKRKLEQELEDEIHAHFEMQIEDNLRQGMSPDEAHYQALRKFGGVERIKESYRDRRSLSLLDSTFQDLRYALRMSGGRRLRPALVVSELSLCLILLIGVSLMAKSLYRLLNLDAGFNRENLLTMQISLPQMKYGSDQQVAAFYPRLLEGVRGAPGVVSATAVAPLPLSGLGSFLSFGIAGRPAGTPDAGGDANVL